MRAAVRARRVSSGGFFRALRKAVRPDEAAAADLPANDGWAAQAGEEFGDLNEAARCDLAFALADLGDERSRRILQSALSDPSEIVALAAAHGLRKLGAMPEPADPAEQDGRAQRIAQTLTLLR